jgi:cystathionine gamma-synthase
VLSHASIPKDEQHIPQDLIRMSIGIEDVNDLIADIRQVI